MRRIIAVSNSLLILAAVAVVEVEAHLRRGVDTDLLQAVEKTRFDNRSVDS